MMEKLNGDNKFVWHFVPNNPILDFYWLKATKIRLLPKKMNMCFETTQTKNLTKCIL